MGVGEGTGVVWGRVLNNSFDNHSIPFLGNPGTVGREKQSKKVIMYRQTNDKHMSEESQDRETIFDPLESEPQSISDLNGAKPSPASSRGPLEGCVAQGKGRKWTR